jgi:hypothetical protein
LLLDSFWRAAAYCLHPRVIMLSLLPLLLISVLALVSGYFFWESAVDAVRARIDGWALLETLFGWLHGTGLDRFKAVLAPLLVVFAATPVIVILSLLAVAALMTPAVLALVAQRRFPALEKRRGGSLLGGVFGAAWATLAALLALVLTLPLWFVPPLVLLLPPLIWGWLAYRVLSYDVLAEHASSTERQTLLKLHRPSLLTMGVVSGYLGAAPSLVWASGVLFVALAPVLVPLAVWIYTLVFAFCSLWFSHFALGALEQLRAGVDQRSPAGGRAPSAPPDILTAPSEPPRLTAPRLPQPLDPGTPS